MKKILISVGIISILSFSYRKYKEPACLRYTAYFHKILDYNLEDEVIDKNLHYNYSMILNDIEDAIKTDCNCVTN